MHIGSGTKTVDTGPDAPTVMSSNLIACNSVASMLDWIFSAKLEQFPKLKLLYAECQIGWIPYFVERADDTWETHQWAQGEKRLPKHGFCTCRRDIKSPVAGPVIGLS